VKPCGKKIQNNGPQASEMEHQMKQHDQLKKARSGAFYEEAQEMEKLRWPNCIEIWWNSA
jgi:hypothetical protein